MAWHVGKKKREVRNKIYLAFSFYLGGLRGDILLVCWGFSSFPLSWAFVWGRLEIYILGAKDLAPSSNGSPFVGIMLFFRYEVSKVRFHLAGSTSS